MRLWLVVALALLLARPALASDYVISVQGQTIGAMSVRADGGRRIIDSETKGDRGMKSRSVVEVGADGRIRRIDFTGKTAGGEERFERFEAAAAGAAWETGIDKGASRETGFYNALSATAEHHAILARALLRAPGGRLRLLPTGEASIVTADRLELATAPGPVPVTLHLIRGLSRRPVPVWLDGSGELAVQVAGVEASTVRADLAASAPRLLEVQEARLVLLDRALARHAVRRPGRPVLIRNANLFDAPAARMRPRTSVLVDGDRIAAVGPDGKVKAPAGALVVDAGGRALVPGLWDAHVHMFDPSEAVMALANGVTAVRDMGNDGKLTSQWRRRFDAGELLGPRLYTGAVIDGPNQGTVPWAHVVKDRAEVEALVDRLADEGYRTVKLFNSLPPELAKPLIDRAHARGLVAGGHLPRGMRLQELIDAGIDESTHFDFFAMQFVGPYAPEGMSAPKRLALLTERAGRIDPEGREVARVLEAMVTRGVSLDPTITGYELTMRDAPGALSSFIGPLADRLPGSYVRGNVGGAPADPAARAKSAAAYGKLLALLGRSAKAGVRIVAGGDGEPGIMIPRELELYVEAGMTPLEALQTATINPARRLGVEKALGSIEAGKLADLILVDGDPSRGVGAVRDVVFVMRNGDMLDIARLNAHVGMRPSKRLAALRSHRKLFGRRH